MKKPQIKPQNPCFSSGPCAKRPGWSAEAVAKYFMAGRSHRAAEPKAQLKAVIDKQKDLLGLPEDYVLGIVPGSDTGAFEMALWSMLGARGVDVFAWEVFSKTWLTDITGHLKLEDIRTFEADFGALPDLGAADPARDIVFTWNGTTSGVRVPDADWIAAGRAGLTFCDATSAVFANEIDWSKLDVITWSWQKVLGGEAAHGMLALSPRAVKRLESYTPPGRALPKVFRLTKKGVLNRGIFEGSTINTPSMWAAADCLDALNWVEELGGLKETIRRSRQNYTVIEDWVKNTAWVDFLAEDAKTRSTTSVCLKITDPPFRALPEEQQNSHVARICRLLEREGAAYDIKSHRDAPPGLRIWCGATVETANIKALLPWLDWSYAQVSTEG